MIEIKKLDVQPIQKVYTTFTEKYRNSLKLLFA